MSEIAPEEIEERKNEASQFTGQEDEPLHTKYQEEKSERLSETAERKVRLSDTTRYDKILSKGGTSQKSLLKPTLDKSLIKDSDKQSINLESQRSLKKEVDKQSVKLESQKSFTNDTERFSRKSESEKSVLNRSLGKIGPDIFSVRQGSERSLTEALFIRESPVAQVNDTPPLSSNRQPNESRSLFRRRGVDVLELLKEQVTSFQEKRGVPRNDYTYTMVISSILTQAYKAVCSVLFLVLAVAPLTEITVHIARFSLERLCEIAKITDQQIALIQITILTLQVFSLLILVAFVFGSILVPVSMMTKAMICKVLSTVYIW